jgi:hypothetical protein
VRYQTREASPKPETEEIVPLALRTGFTYSLQKTLLFILLLGIKALIDEGVSSASATTECSLKTIDGDSFLLNLHGGAELSLDLFLGHVSHIGVDQVDGLKWM